MGYSVVVFIPNLVVLAQKQSSGDTILARAGAGAGSGADTWL